VDGDVRLVIAVGRAAKESVASWLESHGGAADPDALHDAGRGTLPARVRTVGVVHPGSATGSTAAIRADFQRAVDRIRAWLADDAGWLPADPGVPRDLGTPFAYRSAPVPYRDLAFGACPRLGRGGTSSNRSDGQRGIRLFSAAGSYNAAGERLRDPSTAPGTDAGYADEPGDLPYEPPREHPDEYDPGPPADLARLLAGAEPGFAWPDFGALGVTAHPSFGTGPLHRGRFRDLSLIVLTEQQSADDVFTGRAASGEAGQQLQGLLRAAGLTRRYLILRTVPVDTSDLPAATRRRITGDDRVRALHRELLRRVLAANAGVAALLAVGTGAQRLAAAVAPPGLPVIGAAAHGTSGWRASWQGALADLTARPYAHDVATGALPATRGQVPRADLPYGTPRWAGTSGERGVRPVDLTTGRPSPDYLKVFVPEWVARLRPAPLSPAEQKAADELA
jgi:hypothetical protein